MKMYHLEDFKTKVKALNLNWEFKNNGIYKEFILNDFKEALSFMNQVGELAEIQNHHPKWTNLYNKVQIYLTTHDFNGITDKDFNLALGIDQIFSKI
ncbi:MAG: 4a-hydroxytetrahydrobiopterin dehydratase [Flavobacteriaceae bacterium]|nr:4a-hydroxytetrahydrobiopterin dehydratase [Flavobacteriaceae bacterium]